MATHSNILAWEIPWTEEPSGLLGRANSLGSSSWCWERLRAGGDGVTEDELVGWHHWLNGHESEQTLGDSEGQGSLACCSPWGCKESDMTEWLNSNKRGNYICTSLSNLKTLIRKLRKIHTSVSIIPRGWGKLLSLVSNLPQLQEGPWDPRGL